MNKKTLWQKFYRLLGFRFFYEYDENGIRYRTFYWVSKKFWLFSDIV